MRISVRVALCLILLLSGCQTATMSIEEARQVTASFSRTSFVPPPRTIEDIVRMLDERKREETARGSPWYADRNFAERKPLETADAWALGRFYHQRGLAASRVGRIKQAIEDLTQASAYLPPGTMDYTGPSGTETYNLGLRILLQLGDAEAAGGNYWRAISHYERGVSAVGSRERGWRGWLFDMYGPLARLHAATGGLRAADATLDQLLSLQTQSHRWTNLKPEWIANWDAMVASAQAEVLELRGRFPAAEALWRSALASLDPHAGLPWLTPKHDALRARLARCLLRQGRLLEAEVETRTLLRKIVIVHGRYSEPTADVVALMARVLREQGRFTDAETLARAAIEIQDHLDFSSVSSLAVVTPRRELAAALVAQARWAEALAQYEALAERLQDAEMFTRLTDRDPDFALSLLETGRAGEAVKTLERALGAAGRALGERHATTAELRALLAMASAASGAPERAFREFSAAMMVLLDRSLEVDEEDTAPGTRDQRLRRILAAYIGLLHDARGTSAAPVGLDVAAEAFRLADVARGRAVQRALDASAARSAAKTPQLAELVRKEQDVKKQITALEGVLAADIAGRMSGGLTELEAQIAALRQARATLSAQIAKDFPAYAKLVNPMPATLAEIRATLRPGEAVIATYVTDDRTFVWAVPWNGPVAFAAAPMTVKSLATAVDRLRKALDPSAKTLGELPEFDVAAAHELYRTLLEPVAPGWQQAESLLVIPHGPLGQLPFSLLVTKSVTPSGEREPLFSKYRDVPWLVRRHAVTVLPSIGALTTLRRLPPGDPDRRPFVGFGDPYFSQEQARLATLENQGSQPEPARLASRRGAIALRNLRIEKANSARLAVLPRLPDTADEIRSIAAAMRADPGRDVFLGVEANERRVKALNLAEYRVVAFATHGLVPGELDGLTQPALALTAPEVAGVDGDGLLTMEEILALRLNADWVVLSACNTASGQGAGSEAISGLGRAFFYAGARALLVSNWPVETTSARALTTELFRRQATDPGLSRARALQVTMNALIDEGQFVDPATDRAVFSYAHPIFWAPFTLVGDGGGTLQN